MSQFNIGTLLGILYIIDSFLLFKGGNAFCILTLCIVLIYLYTLCKDFFKKSTSKAPFDSRLCKIGLLIFSFALILKALK